MYKFLKKALKSLLADLAQEDASPENEEPLDYKIAAKSLEIKPKLKKASWRILAEEFPKNMKPYLDGFSDEDAHSFCEHVKVNALAGYRADRLATIIQENYKLTDAKAESLASQASSIYMTLFRRLRFREAGITRFIWRTAGDQRVCAECARLNGKTFSYSNPPIVHCKGKDVWTGENCGCRCIEEPILDPIE